MGSSPDNLDTRIMAASFEAGIRTSQQKAALFRVASKMILEPGTDMRAILFQLEHLGIVDSQAGSSAHQVRGIVGTLLDTEAHSQEKIAESSATYRDQIIATPEV